MRLNFPPQLPPRRIAFLAGICVVAIAFSFYDMDIRSKAATPTSQPSKAKSVFVQTAPVTIGSAKQTVQLTGVIVSKESVDVIPASSGVISKLLVTVGQSVNAGQSLAQLDAAAQQARVKTAKGNLDAAEGKLQQAKSEQLAIAKDNVAIETAKLKALEGGPTPAQEAKMKTAVTNAENNLILLKSEQSSVESNDSPVAIAYQRAENVLASIQSGKSPVAVAVTNAQQALNSLENGQAPQSISVNDTSALNPNTDVSVQVATTNLAAVQSSSSPQGTAVTNDQNALAHDQKNKDTSAVVTDEAKLAEDQAVWTKAISQAESQLSTAEANAEQKQTDRENSAAMAQADYTHALQNAQAAYNLAQAQAQQALSNAKLAVQTAAANKLSTFQNMNQQVAKAQNQLNTAKADLTALLAPPSQQAIAEAKAQLDIAQRQLNALESASAGGTIATLEGNVESAQGQLDLAETNLNDMTLRAPITGTVAQIDAQTGMLVGGQKPVFTIIGKSAEIEASVSQQQLDEVKQGDAVTFTLPSAPGKTLTGRVASISPTADPQTLSFTALIVPVSSTVRLASGETAALTVVAKTVNDALLIPSAAVSDQSGSTQVFIIDKGRAVLKNIQTGLVDGDMVQVTSGLKKDDQVVVMGQTFLASGDPVTVAGTKGP